HGFLDNTVLVSDRIILDLLGFVAFQEFGDIKVNKVLTAAVDGVPLATIISKALNADLVIAKKGNEVGIEETLQTRVTVGKTGLMFQLVVGQKQLKRGDIVLIVDDIIRDGATQRALLRLAFKAKTIVKGIFIPISIGREWSREGLQPEIKFKPFLQISP
ncbi:MAG: phosphoribosyltransferase family protein, partial [Candidatus Ranarchaeia archaeon]